MDDIHVDWSQVDSREDALFIGLSAAPDQAWVDAFRTASSRFGSETRGQTWDSIELSADLRHVVVVGLDEGGSPGLRDYVEMLINVANGDAPRERARFSEAQARAEEDARRREQAASRAADELRKQSD